MSSKKGKEKCKDEYEATTSGPQQCGSTRLVGSPSQSPHTKKGGSRKPSNGAKMRDSPPQQWGPRLTKAGNPKRRHPGKSGPGRGGYRAVAAAAQDAQSQSSGLKDALREQADETRVAQEANMSLRRNLMEVQEDYKQAQEELGRRKNEIDEYHLDVRKNFLCRWADETAPAYGLLIALTLGLPLMIVAMAYALEILDVLMQFEVCYALTAYEVLAILIDRFVCTRRGFRSIFSKRATHSYSTTELVDWDTADRRADTMSLRELKHCDAQYGWVQYSHTLNGRNIRRNTFGDLAKADPMLISFELLSQITTPTIMLARDALTAWDRMEASAKSTHTVNIDKRLFTTGVNVVKNTLQVAHALWKQEHQAQLGHFRPALA